MVLTVSFVLSPVTGLVCHRHSRTDVLSAPGRADLNIRELDASVGASGPHDFAVRNNISRQRAVDRSRIQRTRPATPSRAKRVHRIPPRVRDDHDTPLLWGGMAKVLEVICPTGRAKYFFKGGWTDNSLICPSGKRTLMVSPLSRAASAIMAKPLRRDEVIMRGASLRATLLLSAAALPDQSSKNANHGGKRCRRPRL